MANFFQQQILDGNLLLAAIVSLIAGLISFFSPCVLPLVPGYLSYAAGMTELRSKSRTAFGSALFVLGFSVLFISYGALFGSLGSLISTHSRTLTIVLGLLTTAMGIVFLFNERFYRSFKPQWKVRAGLASAPVLGFLFGIGWTPCIGPALAAVQTLAFQESSAVRGAVRCCSTRRHRPTRSPGSLPTLMWGPCSHSRRSCGCCPTAFRWYCSTTPHGWRA